MQSVSHRGYLTAIVHPLLFACYGLHEVTLLGQVFVKDESHKQTIAQLLKAKEASVVSFTLFVVGEGIAKRANDFAAEVAAQAAAAAQK